MNRYYGVLSCCIIAIMLICGDVSTTALADNASLRLIVSGQTIRDLKTGTVWARNGTLASKEFCWLDAQAYLKAMNQNHFGGYRDWDFPSKAALEELADFCAKTGLSSGDRKSCIEVLNSNGFLDLHEGLYWSSSKVGRNNFFTLTWNSSDGTFKNLSKEQSACLLPVHGGR